MKKIESFMLHDNEGKSILSSELINWSKKQKEWKPFNTVKYSWSISGKEFFRKNDGYLCMLPDKEGFILFEPTTTPNNCVLLDAYGKERIRLTVPWELTTEKNPESVKSPTTFLNISEPYLNPNTEEKGEFGVVAWVEHAGDYYFELDWKAGKFLWGRKIRL